MKVDIKILRLPVKKKKKNHSNQYILSYNCERQANSKISLASYHVNFPR